MNHNITLERYRDTHRAALTAYHLRGEQAQYSVSPEHWLQHNPPFNTAQCGVTILHAGEAVGFLVLDCGEDRANYSDNPHAVLLRSMSIAPTAQGKGYARAALQPALLDKLIRAELPADINEIVLGVNHANHSAIRLYQQSGFNDSGRTYEGLKGTQYIYHRPIR